MLMNLADSKICITIVPKRYCMKRDKDKEHGSADNRVKTAEPSKLKIGQLGIDNIVKSKRK